ncbi:hypothetical protein HK097_001345, partial [Rhizophlyctis rosea]
MSEDNKVEDSTHHQQQTDASSSTTTTNTGVATTVAAGQTKSVVVENGHGQEQGDVVSGNAQQLKAAEDGAPLHQQQPAPLPANVTGNAEAERRDDGVAATNGVAGVNASVGPSAPVPTLSQQQQYHQQQHQQPIPTSISSPPSQLHSVPSSSHQPHQFINESYQHAITRPADDAHLQQHRQFLEGIPLPPRLPTAASKDGMRIQNILNGVGHPHLNGSRYAPAYPPVVPLPAGLHAANIAPIHQSTAEGPFRVPHPTPPTLPPPVPSNLPPHHTIWTPMPNYFPGAMPPYAFLNNMPAQTPHHINPAEVSPLPPPPPGSARNHPVQLPRLSHFTRLPSPPPTPSVLETPQSVSLNSPTFTSLLYNHKPIKPGQYYTNGT